MRNTIEEKECEQEWKNKTAVVVVYEDEEETQKER